MTLASELAGLRALARRLDEPWPAEERVAQRVAARRPVWAASSHPAALVELRRLRSFPHVKERIGDRGMPQYDAVQRPLNTAHASLDDAGRLGVRGTAPARSVRLTFGGREIEGLMEGGFIEPERPGGNWGDSVLERTGLPTGNPADRARRGYRFRYADGRVEWRTDVDPRRPDWRLLDAPPGPDAPGYPRTFRRRIFAERGRADIIEYHEDVSSAAGRLEAAALADLDANAFELAEARRSAERREALARASRGDRQRLRIAGELVTYPRSWMPSIAGVGPITLRWPAETVTPEPEAWRTYEAIRASIEWDGLRQIFRAPQWMRAAPVASVEEVAEAWHKVMCVSVQTNNPAPGDLDAFARAVAARLAPPPVHLPAARRDLGALPRDWSGARRRQNLRNEAHEMFGFEVEPHIRGRTTLGTLAARYTPRRPDGTYNRHDARRWMRRFRSVALIASDALETHGTAGREVAITVLRQLVSEEDARKLTERPPAPPTIPDRLQPEEWERLDRLRPEDRPVFTSPMPSRIAPDARVARWTSSAGAGELATMEVSFRDDLRPQPREVTYERHDLALDLAPRQIVRHEIAGEVFDAVVVGLERRHGADGQPRTLVTLREVVRAPARSQAGGQRAPAWSTARGEDLDEEAARLDMARFPGETDERFRRRIAEETGHEDRWRGLLRGHGPRRSVMTRAGTP